jgi:hypothetical protein
MRFSISMTALGFLLVAIAAGMWPSWALASSLSPQHVAVENPAAVVGQPAFKPCYGTVRTASLSCFPQLGLPQGLPNHASAGRHRVEAAETPAMTVAAHETELRPPRSPASA